MSDAPLPAPAFPTANFVERTPDVPLQGSPLASGGFVVAAPAAAPVNWPRDITNEISDLAPEDRVFLTEDGYRVKVKVVLTDVRNVGPAGAKSMIPDVFRLSGSIVGEDGKAMRRPDGSPAVHDLRQTHHHMAHGMGDPIIGLAAKRLDCVEATVRAERLHQIIQAAIGSGAEGVVTSVAQAARKAAEAAAKES